MLDIFCFFSEMSRQLLAGFSLQFGADIHGLCELHPAPLSGQNDLSSSLAFFTMSIRTSQSRWHGCKLLDLLRLWSQSAFCPFAKDRSLTDNNKQAHSLNYFYLFLLLQSSFSHASNCM